LKNGRRNRHHIIPRSRLTGKTVEVPIANHHIYHALFGNMTPPEIVEWLNREFWGNEYEVSIQEKAKK